ncbi:vWA domain-containing protein [Bacillus sp. JJ722]|uniref:vWA domain-containing protein n=1 Tax=Bacillus sp. JJ722 TaxID=3122973 RepID=UPI002FFF4405
MRFIKFNDSTVDSALYIQLQGIAHILTDNENFTFEMAYGHQIDPLKMVITASHFWDHYEASNRSSAYKSDVVLRALGTYHHTDIEACKSFHKWVSKQKHKKFANALFTLLEDVRLEEICKKEKKGTAKWFKVRRELLLSYFHTQLNANQLREFECDTLFCMIAVTLLSEHPVYSFSIKISEHLEELMQGIQHLLYELYDAKNTKDVIRITQYVCARIKEELSEDMIPAYFVFPIHELLEWGQLKNSDLDDLKRKDPLQNKDEEDVDEEEQEVIDETFSTWHGENKNEEQKQTFLRFELEQGTKTSLMGKGAREGSEQDQVNASVQGSMQKTSQQRYEQLQALDKEKTKQQDKKSTYAYGERNQYAKHLLKRPSESTEEQHALYRRYEKDVEVEIMKLRKTLEKHIEQKRNQQRSDLLYGRISKKWVPLLTDPIPRVFYKKHQPSTELDAIFTLLIDCSASMMDKMEETKKAVVLFHEVLKQLRIPHSIVGFWEDAEEAKKDYHPNYYHEVVPFEYSLGKNAGAAIMQLEPQEDNRDGFSIRIAAEELEKRREKHKFLLVFSDGEPSAKDYEKFGIIDTFEAVKMTRKKGIQVVGMFLANGSVEESERELMKNIYEKEHLMIPDMEDLPSIFSAFLKKVLVKTI